MGDPVGAAAHVRESLTPDGAWMIVEPAAKDRLSGNLNPVGRVYYAASTMICTPASLAQEVGLGLGAQAGELKLRQGVTAGGFTRFRRAAETPFNMVLEARPRRAGAERLFRPVEKRLPLLRRAVEGVAIDVAFDPGNRPVGLILPELPGA
jgi:hypothetical protein